MGKRIADYMRHLTAHPEAVEEFRRDARGAMERFGGLSEEEKEIVASGDHDRIRAAVAANTDEQTAMALKITT